MSLTVRPRLQSASQSAVSMGCVALVMTTTETAPHRSRHLQSISRAPRSASSAWYCCRQAPVPHDGPKFPSAPAIRFDAPKATAPSDNDSTIQATPTTGGPSFGWLFPPSSTCKNTHIREIVLLA